MSVYEKPILSAWEHITLCWAIFRIVIAALATVLKTPFQFRGENKAPTLKLHFLYGVVRAFVENITPRQSQALMPSTTEAYEKVAKTLGSGFKPAGVKLADGTLCCWVGDNNADTVIVWFHGGGYVFSASEASIEMISHLVSQTSKVRKTTVAAFIPEYNLAPQAAYPKQLQQAATVIRYLTEDLGKSYSQLIVGGDSAGGNLALGLMSHLSHTHPAIPALDNVQRLKGVFLISPWVAFTQDAPAFRTNKYKDSLSRPALKRWSDLFLGKAPEDEYNSPLGASEDWWRDFQAERILVISGGDELLVDDIVQFTEKLQKHNGQKTELVVARGESHNHMISERRLHIFQEPCESEVRLFKWILDRV
ncbi:Alpha/Beta hydrolase protein [Podospora appendiculata]|uniref:Alpha/Beta hydrolase protein n=1 Tax=Podospora appendiculata TaxID=314037 RepID=A0AAE0X7D5_9PEZI|nr:Alpha/Beta hydrolase protein [Podospora appendiculata]